MTVIVSLIAATSQTVSGFGFALLATPLLTLVMPPSQAVVVVSIVAAPLGWVRYAQERHDVDRPLARTLTLSALPGLPLGLVMVTFFSGDLLRVTIGAVVVVLATSIARGWRLRNPTRTTDAALGFVSGLLSTSTGTNGPPLVVALQSHELAPVAFRATIVAVFVPTGLVTLALFVAGGTITSTGLALAALGFPASMLGNQVGRRLAPRLSPVGFRRLVLVLLFLSGFAAIAKSVL